MSQPPPSPPATYRSGKSPSQLGSFLTGSDLPPPLPEYSCSSGRKQGSRTAPETGYRAGSLGSISASDLGATHGPPSDLRNTLQRPKLLPAQHPPGSFRKLVRLRMESGVAMGILGTAVCFELAASVRSSPDLEAETRSTMI